MSKKFPTLAVIDLLARVGQQSAPQVHGRRRESDQIARVLQRKRHSNVLIVGRRGVGKTSLIAGFIRAIARRRYPFLRSQPFLAFDVLALTRLLHETIDKEAAVNYLARAWQSLPASVVVLDDLEQLLEEVPLAWQFGQLFSPFFSSPDRHLVLVLEEEEWSRWVERYDRFLKFFDVLHLPELSSRLCERVIGERARMVAASCGLNVTHESVVAIGEYGQKLSLTRAMPDRALRFLDEVVAACQLQGKSLLTRLQVETIFAERQRLPARQLTHWQRSRLQTLEARLGKQIIGQPHVLGELARVVQRGLLGVKNPKRPLGSFLFFGPSGVGKTEVARVLAREVYGRARDFVRLDMSEYGEPHTVQRLVGSPPGYVGHEGGGQLTQAVARQPFSLILLDEIEKAHPAVFDMFLQVLEDGRLTDGRGETVDFCHTIIVATSNIGTEQIVAGWQAGQDVRQRTWLAQHLMPVLTQRFRLEFLNRFEAMCVFQPFSVEHLMAVARLEIAKLERRLGHHHVKLSVPDEWLSRLVQSLADPRFGARPIKRFVEQVGEEQLARHLLAQAV